MLEDEGLGENDQPASAVLHAAICIFELNVVKYRTDEGFKQALQSIENSFRNSIFLFYGV
jgi:hypothetical protein